MKTNKIVSLAAAALFELSLLMAACSGGGGGESPPPAPDPYPYGLVIERVSVDSSGNEGDGESSSYGHSLSADGRYVVFTSSATNLVAGDTNGQSDVFVHDRKTGETTRVSVDSAGNQGDGSSSEYPTISADGRYVAFSSSATNLVSGDTNGLADIFVHDRQTGATTRVSVNSAGNQSSGCCGSDDPSISADGRYVAFDSTTTDLVPNDTNGVGDVFVHDRLTGETTRVSVDSEGNQVNMDSANPSISADGRYVAFDSWAMDLVPDDTNADKDIFVHDRQTGETIRVSVDSNGAQGNRASYSPSISADGRYVAFSSLAANLVPGDTNGAEDVFVRDLQTGATTRVSADSAGNQGSFESFASSISADGRYVAFFSGSDNLAPYDTNSAGDIFVHDRQTGVTTRLSLDSAGNEGNDSSSEPSISGDGKYVAFMSYAQNLVSGDTNLAGDIFVASVKITTLSGVAALYPTNGANWNDYVKNDGPDRFSATGAACTGTETGGYNACIHGGEARKVTVTGKTSCTGLTAADALGAFNWTCDASANPVRMVSTGLKAGKNLSDLIDFSAVPPAWKANRVMVYEGGSLYGVTPSSAWWANTVVENNIGESLATPGTVYVITSNVTGTMYTFGADKTALVIKPGVTLQGPGTNSTVITANSRKFLWFEGSIDAVNDYTGVFWQQVAFSVMRNAAVSNGNNGIYLVISSNNTLLNVSASNNASVGVSLGSSTNNTLTNLTALNDYRGVYLGSSSNNMLLNVTASNGQIGVDINASSNNTFSNLTVSNNGLDGAWLSNSSNNNVLSNVNWSNGQYGVEFANSSNNTLSNITSASNTLFGVYLSGSSNNYFTGLLKVGNNAVSNCSVSGGTNPGLVSSTCTETGLDGSNSYGAGNASDAIFYTTGITLASSFVGKVTTDDTANASDTDGIAAYPADPSTFDWTRFDNSYRGWGPDGSAFPSADNRGRWTTGQGRIWDWSLMNTDMVIRNVLSLPTGSDTLTHTWSDNSAITILRNAVEIMGDGIGNDNTLCESNETCLYTPNIGSYQGHGSLIDAGSIGTGGTLENITLKKYQTNGY